MALIKLSQAQRLYIVIGISACFFITEIVIGFYTHSLALIADAFHYLSDLTGFIVALTAILITKRGKSPQGFSFGWQRARLLGAFFNGVFLAALGLSIFLQSLERLVSIQKVEQPKLVLIVGAIGLTLNIISGAFLHEHDHGDHAHVSSGDDIPLEETSGTFSPTTASFNVAGAGVHNHHRHRTAPTKPGHHRDLGMLGAFIHVCGDAANNIGVIIAATIIWQTKSEKRYYADPAISMLISVMIAITSFPLIKNSGRILLESAPSGMNIMEVQKDLEELPGINSVHELHVWRLDQQRTIASLHVVTEYTNLDGFTKQAQQIGECLHEYGVHSFTVQPESTYSHSQSIANFGLDGTSSARVSSHDMKTASGVSCRIRCREGSCEQPQCCD